MADKALSLDRGRMTEREGISSGGPHYEDGPLATLLGTAPGKARVLTESSDRYWKESLERRLLCSTAGITCGLCIFRC